MESDHQTKNFVARQRPSFPEPALPNLCFTDQPQKSKYLVTKPRKFMQNFSVFGHIYLAFTSRLLILNLVVENFPRGYPSLSAFLSSDRDFTMFRCFSRLHVRVLLHKQDDLIQLEQKLYELDRTQEDTGPHLLKTNRRCDGDKSRQVLIQDVEMALKEYNTLLESFLRHLERPEPEESQIKYVLNWMEGHKPLTYAESSFLNDWSDLRRVRPTVEKGGLETFVGRCATSPGLGKVHRWLSPSDSSSKSDDPRIKLLKEGKVVAASRALTTIFAIATIIVPIGVLYSVQAVASRLGLIAAFTALFSSALCWLTSSRNHEIFSATAAYCAVMVVFVGSLPGS